MMIEGTLWDAVVVDLEIVTQRGFELGNRAKAVLPNKLTDAAVEAFHYAVLLQMARWNEPMFDGHVLVE